MRVIVVLFFLPVLVFITSLSHSEANVTLQNRELLIVSDTSLELTQHFLSIFPQIKTEVEGSTGLRLQSRPILMLIQDHGKFEAISGSPFITAFAVPQRNLIVMHVSPADTRRYLLLEDTLRHELCHLILHSNIPSSSLPKWLDEGVCQWVSGTMGEFLLRGPMGQVNFPREYIPLSHLVDGFPQDRRSLELAYWQSRSFVQHLSSKYGSERIISLLHALKSGSSLEQAFMSIFGQSLEAVEKQWRVENSNLHVWFIWVNQNLYPILFFFAALLVVVAFIRRKLIDRERRLTDYGDEDEL